MTIGSPPEQVFYEGIGVDVLFDTKKPCFGDLFCICGDRHPRFPPTGDFGFASMGDLQFEQVDDYFGIRAFGEEGDDVAVWLFPLIAGEEVYHDHGPFDGVRLTYAILRHPTRRAEHFLRCVQRLAVLGDRCLYRDRDCDLGVPPDLTFLKRDIETVIQHWAQRGVTVGSLAALEIDD